MDPAHLSANDGFVIAMFAMTALSLAVLGILGLSMRRSAARRDPQVDELLEELAEMEKMANPPPTSGENPNSARWEKPGDWWKC